MTKRDLVTRALVLLEQGRLRFAKAPGLDVLTRELEGYRVRLSADGHDSYGAETEAVHDDTVMALCLAVWDDRTYGRVIDLDDSHETAQTSTARPPEEARANPGRAFLPG